MAQSPSSVSSLHERLSPLGSITGEDEGAEVSLVSITRQPFLSIGAVKNEPILGLMRSTGGVGRFMATAESAYLITRQPTLLISEPVLEQVEASDSANDEDDASWGMDPEASQLNESLIVSFSAGVVEA